MIKKFSILFVLLFSESTYAQQKIVPVDSTVAIITEWINVISEPAFIEPVCMRGVSKETYNNNLKIINQSLDNYKSGKFNYAFEDADDITLLKFPEISRIRLFMMTMSKIRLNKKFKARKYYYVAENKMDTHSMTKLKNNIEQLKLGYKINNYKRVRGGRLTALFICGGILGISSLASGE
jgi:hypothetical protein